MSGIFFTSDRESCSAARQLKPECVIEISDQCLIVGVPFFFKQWGGTNKKKQEGCWRGRFGNRGQWWLGK